MAKGGDIREITYNHPTVGQGVFLPKAGENSTIDLGGFRNVDDASMITASGEMMQQKNRVRGGFECLCSDNWLTRKDSEIAKLLATSEVDADWTIEHINGTVYGCTGHIVGDIQTDTNAGTFTIKVAAPELKEI